MEVCMTVRGKQKFFFGVVVPLVAMMYGCAVDSMDVIEHPSAVSPGHQFEATLGNTVMFISPGRLLLKEVKRDSIHFAVGMPNGWSVVSAGYVLAEDLKLIDELGAFTVDSTGELDSADAAKALLLLKAKVNSYKSQMKSLQTNTAILSVLENMDIDAELYGIGNDDDSEIEVNYDSVDQWFGFSGHIGLSQAQYSEMDTVVWIPDTSGESEIDSIGMSAVPVFLYLTIKAPMEMGDDTLYYYTKTGSMRIDTSELGLDAGMMKYVPIKVSTVGTIAGTMVKRTTSGLSILQRQNGAIDISTADKRFIGSKGAIYTMRGTLVREFTLSADGLFSWDRKDRSGKAVSLNTYVIRLGASGNVKTGTTTLMK